MSDRIGDHWSHDPRGQAGGPARWEVVLVALAALAAGLGAAAVHYLVLDGIPHVQDSIAYLWQARVFASGHLSLPSHPLAEFFTFRFMVNDGRWYTLFQPGWPMALALGVLGGLPGLVNPLLASLTVVGTWLLGRRTLGPMVGTVAAWLLAVCPFFPFMHGSMMSHGLSAALGLWATVALLEGEARSGWVWYVVSGALVGALLVTRALDGLVTGLILGGYLLTRAADRPSWPRVREGLMFAAAATLLGSFQLYYNQSLTGSWRIWPQDRYFQLTEPNPECHRLGFGPDVGCTREHGPDVGRGGFWPRDAVRVTGIRMRALVGDLWGSPLGLIVVALGMVLARSRGLMLTAMTLGPILGYGLYYYHGNCFGARYYFGITPFAALLGASVVTRLASRPGWLGRTLAAFLAGGLVVPSLAVEIPRRAEAYSGAYWGVHAGLGRLIEEQDLDSAVVITPRSRHGADLDDRDYRIGFVAMGPDVDHSKVVVARDLGISNPQLAAYFTGRRFFRYRPWTGPRFVGRLMPLDLSGARALHVLEYEGEDRFPPPHRSGGVVRIGRLTPDLGPRPSNGHVLTFEPGRQGGWFEVRAYVLRGGTYRVSAKFGRGPDRGVVAITVDGARAGEPFDGYANRVLVAGWAGDVDLHLTPGLHWVRFQVIGASPASEGMALDLDRLTLTRVGD